MLVDITVDIYFLTQFLEVKEDSVEFNYDLRLNGLIIYI